MEENQKNIVEEPALAYQSMKTILGGKDFVSTELMNDLDLIKLSRAGLKKESIVPLAGYLGLSLEAFSKLLHTSYRNLQRKDGNELLDSHKTEKMLEISSFVAKGISIFGNEDDFKLWLHSPILALNNNKPVDFLDTSFGIQMVNKVLGRFQTGVYS